MSKNLYVGTFAFLVGLGMYVAGRFHEQYLGRSSVDAHSTDAHSTESDAHAGHEHESTSESLELSDSARKNLGLSDEFLKPIELRSYQHVITVPSIVVDRPGRTRLPVSAAMTGIITHVHTTSGESIEPGDLILEMRLTHEDLVTAQKEYLQSLGDRDIETKEIARLEGVASSGAVSTKTLLERQYNRDKLDSLLRSQREALRLHGITDDQIATIDTDRKLLTEIQVFAPDPDDHADDHKLPLNNSSPIQPVEAPNSKSLLVLQEMKVQKGQTVEAGETLCILADYAQLLVEGQAFEAEVSQIANAKKEGWPVSAVVGSTGETQILDGLKLSWINNEIDPATRTLKFYVTLNNHLVTDERNSEGQRHIAWKYRVGQRMELGIPIAQWTDQIVIPLEGVVREGVDSFVFQQNGDHFDRVAIHEKHRDRLNVVIENDGALFPGDVVAMKGAHQMQMALKNKSGGGIDPHAGHNH